MPVSAAGRPRPRGKKKPTEARSTSALGMPISRQQVQYDKENQYYSWLQHQQQKYGGCNPTHAGGGAGETALGNQAAALAAGFSSTPQSFTTCQPYRDAVREVIGTVGPLGAHKALLGPAAAAVSAGKHKGAKPGGGSGSLSASGPVALGVGHHQRGGPGGPVVAVHPQQQVATTAGAALQTDGGEDVGGNLVGNTRRSSPPPEQRRPRSASASGAAAPPLQAGFGLIGWRLARPRSSSGVRSQLASSRAPASTLAAPPVGPATASATPGTQNGSGEAVADEEAKKVSAGDAPRRSSVSSSPQAANIMDMHAELTSRLLATPQNPKQRSSKRQRQLNRGR